MKHRQPAIGFIFVTLVLDILGIGLIIPILPKLVEKFQGGDVAAASGTVGMLGALYALMQFLFAPLLGSLSDRFGRRPIILTSLLGSGLDYFLLAFAPNLGWFYVGRIISGITGANISAASAYIADVSPPEKRAGNFGLMGAAFGLGFIIGPLLGGLLGEHGERVPFIVAGTLTLINWAYGYFMLPESLKPENRRVFSWDRSNPIGSLLYLRQHPIAFGLAGSHFLIYLGHQVFPATWVLYTGYRFGWTSSDVGISLAVVGVMAGIVQGGLTRHIVTALGERKTVVVGLIMATIAYLSYGLANHGWMLYAVLIYGSLGGVTGPALQAIITHGVKADEQGGVQGSLTSLSSVAGILGTPIAAGIFGYFSSGHAALQVPGMAFFFSAGLTMIALVLAVRSFRKHEPVMVPVTLEAPSEKANTP